jgi:putative spermidine/putrescine transport system ATP-binding protein
MSYPTYTEEVSAANERTGAAIRIREITKRFGDLTVLDDISFDIRAGEFITLLGASGSGKSTLLNIIAGFTPRNHGTIEVDGQDITKKPPHRRGVGMVFQHYALFPHMTVFDNVAFGLRRHNVPKKEVADRVAEALDMIQMRHLADRKPDQLSGGQQQRVALARGIVFRPRVLLMDEPLGALDKLLREELQLEIRNIHHELGITFIFVTHDQHEALTMSDRIALLRNGKIVQIDTPRGLYENPNCRYSAEFLGVSNLFTGRIESGTFHEDKEGFQFNVPEGEGNTLLIRPEHLHVQVDRDTTTTSGDSLPGTVEDFVYLGSDVTVHVRTPGGQLVIARAPVASLSEGIDIGAAVRCSWQLHDVRLIAEDVEDIEVEDIEGAKNA